MAFPYILRSNNRFNLPTGTHPWIQKSLYILVIGYSIFLFITFRVPVVGFLLYLQKFSGTSIWFWQFGLKSQQALYVFVHHNLFCCHYPDYKILDNRSGTLIAQLILSSHFYDLQLCAMDSDNWLVISVCWLHVEIVLLFFLVNIIL